MKSTPTKLKPIPKTADIERYSFNHTQAIPALRMGVMALRIDANPAVEYWVARVIKVKGRAVLISPSTTKCFH